ncbi:MAG: prephenate dehydrogenase/arogenate dehydrogenase family protein [Acidobacteriota bacterium]|nr:prephenate dehydrogenase/arogenate dehydrogenase family protein [Acidobacteriota bacterium]
MVLEEVEQLRSLPVGILGYGRFGRAWAQLLEESGARVRAHDPRAEVPVSWRADSPAALLGACRLIFVAVPVPALAGALESLAPRLRPEHLLIDVSSVKVEPVRAMASRLGGRCRWVPSHPLFGPTSLALGERPLRVVVCPEGSSPRAVELAAALYRELGCAVTFKPAEAHDREMAESHAMAYFVAKALVDAGLAVDSELAPPSAQAIARTVEAVRSDAGHLLTALHCHNPHAAEARARFVDALVEIDRRLGEPAAVEAAEAADAPAGDLSLPDLGRRSPELREVREVIDDLDRQLVELLSRRARLARRAARAKSDLGQGVRDAGRESQVLERRRQWAAERGLAPADVARVFEEILRFSRRLQLEEKR